MDRTSQKQRVTIVATLVLVLGASGAAACARNAPAAVADPPMTDEHGCMHDGGMGMEGGMGMRDGGMGPCMHDQHPMPGHSMPSGNSPM